VQTTAVGARTTEKEWATQSHALSAHIGAKRAHDVIRA